jgi:hypothetical protein
MSDLPPRNAVRGSADPPSHPWSAPLRAEDIPETGRQVTLVADERARRAIAEITGLRGLPRLEGTFEITRSGPGGVRVIGRLSATVEQTCVLTLEPIENEVNEVFDLVFKPAQGSYVGQEVSVDPDADDTEALIDGVVDLGALATEFLILGLDPYPRKPGAVFEPPQPKEPLAGPFAALAALQKKPPR